jgi:hypothetical protein
MKKKLYMQFQAKLPQTFHQPTYMDMKKKINMHIFKIWFIVNKPNYEEKSIQINFGWNWNQIEFKLVSIQINFVRIETKLNANLVSIQFNLG